MLTRRRSFNAQQVRFRPGSVLLCQRLPTAAHPFAFMSPLFAHRHTSVRDARLLIIGCVGGIMTSGRRQEAAEREAERRPAHHAGSAAVSEALPSQMPYKDVSESVRRK